MINLVAIKSEWKNQFSFRFTLTTSMMMTLNGMMSAINWMALNGLIHSMSWILANWSMHSMLAASFLEHCENAKFTKSLN